MIISGSYRCRCRYGLASYRNIYLTTAVRGYSLLDVRKFRIIYKYLYMSIVYLPKQLNTVIIYKTTGEMVKRILFIRRLRKIRDGKHDHKRTKICIQSGILIRCISLPRIRYDVIRSTNILQFFFFFSFYENRMIGTP